MISSRENSGLNNSPQNAAQKGGFSLLEILIALIIGSIGLSFLIQLMHFTMKGGKRISAKLDFDNTGMLITRLLTDPLNCLAYFGNRTFLSASAGLSSQVIGATGRPLSIYIPGAPENIVAKPGNTITGTLETDSLVIRDIAFQSTDKPVRYEYSTLRTR